MAESSSTTKVAVAKLTDQNYQSWKFKIRMLLIREGTWKYVHKDRPDEPSNKWIEKDEKAQSTISLSIEGSQIVHICKCETTKEIWEDLQRYMSGLL